MLRHEPLGLRQALAAVVRSLNFLPQVFESAFELGGVIVRSFGVDFLVSEIELTDHSMVF